jgi:hypothetical protein
LVLELRVRNRSRLPALILAAALLGAAPDRALAGEPAAGQYLRDAQALYQSGQYFKAARYAFAAQEGDPALEAEGYSWITIALMRAGLPNAASYFFVRTLQTGDKTAVRRVLTQTQDLLVRVGGDLMRKYLIRHTAYEDYDAINRSAYLYALGKDRLLAGDEEKAVGYLNGMSSASPLWPFALQLRGSAHAILGRNDQAIADFRACASKADDYLSASGDPVHRRRLRQEADDLEARCRAGEARTLYQMERFADADRAYDRIPKGSLVWPDILFEQAWNAFGRGEYNRTLGKLVSYKSPGLGFVFNTENDVLRAQAFLALCLYADANDAVNEFNAKYTKVGEEVKRFVERNSSNLGAFFEAGKEALAQKLHAANDFNRMANRFVRGPYFQNLVAAERAIAVEAQAVPRFDAMQVGVAHEPGRGFPGFLEQVLRWRLRTVRLLGGAYVKNSFLDYHAALISDFEKMAFIKLEMLSRAKDKLLRRSAEGERSRGNIEPSRRDDQYYWGFNGEFWNDELGDYVFGLESECRS